MRLSQQAVKRRRSANFTSGKAIYQSMIDSLEPRCLLSGETISAAIPAILAHSSSPSTDSVTLDKHFTNPIYPGTIAYFNTSKGQIEVALTDEATPLTVANFLSYVNSGAYNDTFFHRSVNLETGNGATSTSPATIIQGGGYTFNGPKAVHIPTGSPVDDEYSTELYGDIPDTLAMAKTSDANSATSEWYFNVVDNTSELDKPTTDSNGVTTSYTVFGKVVTGTGAPDGVATINTIAALPAYDINTTLPTVPVTGLSQAQVTAQANITANNLIYTYSITTVPGTTYTAISDNNALVTPKITDGVLSFTYSSTLSGTADIAVTAKNVDGTTATDVFPVTVPNSATPTAGPVTAAYTAPFVVTGTTGTFSVLGPDTDSVAAFNPDSVTVTAQPAHGTATVNPANGFITYTPAAGYIGADSLKYIVADTAGTVSSPATVTLSAVSPPVTVTIGNSTARSLSFTQPDGTSGLLTVTGGTAVVTFADYRVTTTTAKGIITATGAGTTISSIDITSTAKQIASITLASKGAITVGSITDDNNVDTINAPTVTLTGASVFGSLRNVSLAGLSYALITIKGGAVANLSIPTVTNSSISASGVPIGNIQSNEWLNTDGGNYAIFAPSIVNLKVKGTFAESLDLTNTGYSLVTANVGGPSGVWNLDGSLFSAAITTPGSTWQLLSNGVIGKLDVKGSLSSNLIDSAAIGSLSVTGTTTSCTIETAAAFNAKILQMGKLSFGGAVTSTLIISAGNIGTISGPSFTGTRIYAGITATTTSAETLPSSTADVASNAKIVAVTLGKGTDAFSNSIIGADSIGSLKLGDVQTSNGGIVEGVAAHSIGNVTAKLGTSSTIVFGPAQLKSAATLAAYVNKKNVTLDDFNITLFS